MCDIEESSVTLFLRDMAARILSLLLHQKDMGRLAQIV